MPTDNMLHSHEDVALLSHPNTDALTLLTILAASGSRVLLRTGADLTSLYQRKQKGIR